MTGEELLAMARGYQGGAVLMAAAELDVFEALAAGPLPAQEVATRLGTDQRATRILLDALAALGILTLEDGRYRVPAETRAAVTPGDPGSVLPMLQHQASCMRRWADLARVCTSGEAAARTPSVRGEDGERESFINAMVVASRPQLQKLVPEITALEPRHLLDLGGGPGLWSIACLQALPELQVTYVDLPEVVPIAQGHVATAGLSHRVRFVPGSYLEGPLPAGADLAWISAIVHQHSREENRTLFARAREALVPGGRVLIRDILMEDNRTAPVAGALFAVNMLVGTAGGNAFTFAELAEDLTAAGLEAPTLHRRGELMDSLVLATRPTA
jgi:predicted O-methyltransferase YrrM